MLKWWSILLREISVPNQKLLIFSIKNKTNKLDAPHWITAETFKTGPNICLQLYLYDSCSNNH